MDAPRWGTSPASTWPRRLTDDGRLPHLPPLSAVPGYDLHTHSTFSDGTATPAENVALARERGLEGIAVTDHDTMDGWGEALAAASDSDLRIVPGVELSAEHDGASLHVLGYWVDPAHEGLRSELRRLHDTRFRRGEMIVEKLHALGHDISFERVRRIAGDDLIARPHIAQAMVETGIVATERDAFDSYISDDGPAYVPKHALAPVNALSRSGRGPAREVPGPGRAPGSGRDGRVGLPWRAIRLPPGVRDNAIGAGRRASTAREPLSSARAGLDRLRVPGHRRRPVRRPDLRGGVAPRAP
ncbi:MAG: PHP domain-containing protein [Actinobacteria bacterium]|nr:MAG: PHP domain-containing protein [Actinomycetota bacterium]